MPMGRALTANGGRTSREGPWRATRARRLASGILLLGLAPAFGIVGATARAAVGASATAGVTPTASPPVPASASMLPARDTSPIVVALDPGHGGTNLGAAGPGRGIFEKTITLALAERVRTLLAQISDPPISAVLCREADLMVPIRARARCALEAGARAFISLHANAVPAGVQPGSQRGFEVFVLGPREVEDDATLASVAQISDADAAWAAHEVRAAAERSIALGRVIGDALARGLGAEYGRGMKQSGAALDVLRGTGTASALVEVGFLDHPEEGAKLATAAGREPIAQALAAGVRTYLSTEALTEPLLGDSPSVGGRRRVSLRTPPHRSVELRPRQHDATGPAPHPTAP